jgi:hypothetical protein
VLVFIQRTKLLLLRTAFHDQNYAIALLGAFNAR